MSEHLLLFGGSFDPPHRAHLLLADHARRATGATKVLFIPARQNPHKSVAPGASGAQRVAMLRAALSESPLAGCAEIDELELARDGPSYFALTVTALRERHPGARLSFLIGSDQALSFHRWHEPQTILRAAEPVVVLRPPLDREAFLRSLAEGVGSDAAASWAPRIIDAPALPDASTDLRQLLASGRFDDAAAQLSPGVLSYIRQSGLYGAPESP